MSDIKTVPYEPARIPIEQGSEQLKRDLECAQARRTVRMFSSDPVPREMIENALLIAGTAPSGAHRQPWTFVAISDPEFKTRLRERVE